MATHREIFRAIEENDLEALKKLYREGADIHAKDLDGDAPLTWAVGNGHLSIVKFLISVGAYVNCRDDAFRATPLHWAAQEDRWEIAEYLITMGADVNAINALGQTPLYVANGTKSWNVAEVLRKHGARG